MGLNQKIREFLFSGMLNIKWYALFLGFILFMTGWIIAFVNYDDIITIKIGPNDTELMIEFTLSILFQCL